LRIKRDVRKAEDRQPVTVYEGPTPPDGTYRAQIRSIRLRKWKTGKQYLNVLPILDAKDKEGQNAPYDGYAGWTPTTIDSGNEVGDAREKSLYLAIAGKAQVDIDVDDKVQGDPIVTKVGGVNPNGVYVFVKLETDPEYGQKGQWIYPDPSYQRDGQPEESGEDQGSESELDIEAEAKATPAKKAPAAKKVERARKLAAVPEPSSDEVDYDSMTVPALRKAARAAGIDTEGVSKADLISQLKGEADDRDPNKKNPQDIYDMSDQELEGFIEGIEGWDWADFDGMKRKDIVEVLVDEGDINPF
jgi:hypothetical protein